MKRGLLVAVMVVVFAASVCGELVTVEFSGAFAGAVSSGVGGSADEFVEGDTVTCSIVYDSELMMLESRSAGFPPPGSQFYSWFHQVEGDAAILKYELTVYRDGNAIWEYSLLDSDSQLTFSSVYRESNGSPPETYTQEKFGFTVVRPESDDFPRWDRAIAAHWWREETENTGGDEPERIIPIDRLPSSRLWIWDRHWTSAWASDGQVSYSFDIDSVEVTIGIEVEVDVRPRQKHNKIALRKRGWLPVALLSADGFASADVDQDSLLIGDPAAEGAVAPRHVVPIDIDRDGDRDLLLLFRMGDLMDSGAISRESEELLLTGELDDGREFHGVDGIEVVGGRRGRPHRWR